LNNNLAADMNTQSRPANPMVTVLMSVYNGADYSYEAMNSILGQTFTDFEFLIIDDGSTDSSRDIIREYQDPRINLVENKTNIGLPASLNKGISLSNGSYIARQDADDISYPTRLEEQVAFAEKSPDCALICCSWDLIDTDGSSFGQMTTSCDHDEIMKGLIPNKIQFPHGSYLVRTKALETIGGYDERFFYTQDDDLLLRMSMSFRFGAVPSLLYRLRVAPWQTNLKILCQERYRKLAQKKYANPGVSIEVPTISEMRSLLADDVQTFGNSEARYWYSLARESWRLKSHGKSARYLIKSIKSVGTKNKVE
jgi:glycosyltransferase involved in cell wall biosynthesis